MSPPIAAAAAETPKDNRSSTASTAHSKPAELVEQPPTKPTDGRVTYVHTDDAPVRDHREKHKPLKVLTEEDCYDELAFGWPEWKKWWVITVIFLVQCSMNLNTSLYSNGISSRPDHKGMTEEFGISAQAARCGAMVFLVTYAFGCELWAPWSEEFGRKPILQISLFLVNVWQLPVGLAPNFGSVMAGRALGGLCSAGGSVTLGVIADLWEPEEHGNAVAVVVLSSVGGSVLGAVVGGFSEQYQKWQWTVWLQLIFGGFVQILHLLTVPESRSSTMMTAIAKRRRKNGEEVWGPDEVVPWSQRLTFHEILTTWTRPFVMFLTEPIVLVLSLLSGFSDGLIFVFIQSFSLVYAGWDFKPYQVGLAFVPLGIGYILAMFIYFWSMHRNKVRRSLYPDDERVQYEERLFSLLYLSLFLPIGLISFAWTSGGPPIHWIGSMICSSLVGIANYAIYAGSIDYMMTAYGPYSASATGGNGWSRDMLAGVLTMPATPFFTNIGPAKNGEKHYHHLQYASTILFCISTVLVCAVYVIYWKGPVLRARSPFAQQLSDERKELHEHLQGLTPQHSAEVAAAGSDDLEKAAATATTAPGAASPGVTPAATPGAGAGVGTPRPGLPHRQSTAARPGLGAHRHSTARMLQEERVRPGLHSRRSTYMAEGIPPSERSRAGSRVGSRAPSRAGSINGDGDGGVEGDVDAAGEGGGPEHPATLADRLQARLMRPGLGSRHSTWRSTHSGGPLAGVREATGHEDA